jgi:hypothetical protein
MHRESLEAGRNRMPRARFCDGALTHPAEIAMIPVRPATLVVIAVLIASCGSPPAPRSALPMDWQSVDSLNALLPGGIRVFGGRNDSLPLRAWYVRIDERDPDIATRVVVSDDGDRKESVTDFAADPAVCVAVNAGYFQMAAMPAEHAGLLLMDGRVVAPSTRSTVRDSIRYPLARAAIGFTAEGEIDVTWALSRGDSVLTLEDPLPNRPGRPAPYPDGASQWTVREAIGAGPAIVMGDSIRITSDEEGFFGTSIPETHPRTAAGYTADGDLLLLVVDGRQEASRGVSLEELATLMIELGAVEALNLDGGGSSTLSVRGRLVNRPAGGLFEREVMSALVTYCGD